jgi:hypothetical protein
MPGKFSELNKHKRRESNIIAAVACPVCGAPVGQKCRAGVHPHDPRRGVEDLREIMPRVHSARRAAKTALNDVAAVPVTRPLVSARDLSGVPTEDLRWEDMDERREIRRRRK